MDPIQAFLDELTNASGGVGGYESPATGKVDASVWVARRYGCDKIVDHRRHARCMLRGRIDFLQKKRDIEKDPRNKMILNTQIAKWEKKFSEELGRSRFRKD
jgi:hypothetical protein